MDGCMDGWMDAWMKEFNDTFTQERPKTDRDHGNEVNEDKNDDNRGHTIVIPTNHGCY